MNSTFHLGVEYQTFSLGCNFFITDLVYGSRTDINTGLPFVYAEMELESAFVATDKTSKARDNIDLKEGDRVVVRAEILFPNNISDSSAVEKYRVISNKINFGEITWGRTEDIGITGHDVYVDISLTLPKEMLNNILLLSKENRFYAAISYWLYTEEKTDGPPEQKFIIDDFRLEKRQTHYYDWHTMRRGASTIGSPSLILKLWQYLRRHL